MHDCSDRGENEFEMCGTTLQKTDVNINLVVQIQCVYVASLWHDGAVISHHY